MLWRKTICPSSSWSPTEALIQQEARRTEPRNLPSPTCWFWGLQGTLVANINKYFLTIDSPRKFLGKITRPVGWLTSA